MLALCLTLALLATDGDGLRFEGSVAAGGGYDANLLIAPGSDAAGSAVASVSASGGATIGLSDSAFLYVGAALDGSKIPTLPELDRTSAGASASLLVELVGPLALVLGTSGGFGWYADPARSGASFTARATLRYRPMNWFTTRLGYAHTLRTASDPVYGSNVDRIFAEVEFRAARSTWFSIVAFGERGDQTFYQAILPASELGTTAATVTIFEPYRATATTLGVGVGFEQGLGGGFSVDLGATWRRTDTPDGAYSGPSASATVVWRWD
ncbi:MAG: hypothetical protein WCK73_14030 [Deltaproteobacteria bacterium]